MGPGGPGIIIRPAGISLSFLIYLDQISDGNIYRSILIILHDQTKLEQVHLPDIYCVTVRPCKSGPNSYDGSVGAAVSYRWAFQPLKWLRSNRLHRLLRSTLDTYGIKGKNGTYSRLNNCKHQPEYERVSSNAVINKRFSLILVLFTESIMICWFRSYVSDDDLVSDTYILLRILESNNSIDGGCPKSDTVLSHSFSSRKDCIACFW